MPTSEGDARVARLAWREAHGGPRWLAAEMAGFAVAFTSRHGGRSRSPYDTLNVAYHVGDEPDDVTSNRSAVAGALGFEAAQLTTARQVHGTEVKVVGPGDVGAGSTGMSTFEADSLVTDVPGTALGVMVADCVPVVLIDRANGAAGVVHAGWRGVLERALPEAVEKMRTALKTGPADLVAFIGPHIKACCLELDEDTVSRFRDAFGPVAIASAGHVDLESCLRAQLREAAGKPVPVVSTDACTACDPGTFFSYRRARDGVTGRQMGIVVVPTSA
jgi:hypothetical protein